MAVEHGRAPKRTHCSQLTKEDFYGLELSLRAASQLVCCQGVGAEVGFCLL